MAGRLVRAEVDHEVAQAWARAYAKEYDDDRAIELMNAASFERDLRGRLAGQDRLDVDAEYMLAMLKEVAVYCPRHAQDRICGLVSRIDLVSE